MRERIAVVTGANRGIGRAIAEGMARADFRTVLVCRRREDGERAMEEIASHTGSYVGENRLLEKLVLAGTLPLKLMPQGTLAEAIRAGGAGIPAFFTPTGVGTMVADGKEVREFDGRQFILERALTADYAIIKAWKGDRLGNLVYRKAARNFNPIMATAAAITIAEIEQLVEPGEIDPDHIVTPGIYVHRLVVGERFEKRIERRTVRNQPTQEQAK